MAGDEVTRADINKIYRKMSQAKLERSALMAQIILSNHKLMMEKIDRLVSEAKNQSNRKAVEFLNNQVTVRIAQANFIIGALMIANNEYIGILNVKDAQKGIGVDFISVALILIPGVGPIAAGLKEWSDNGTAIKKFAAHLGNNINDLVSTVSNQNVDADNTSLNVSASANTAIRKALSAAYKQIGLALILHSSTVSSIINSNLSESQIKDLWKTSGMEILDAAEIGTLIANPNNLDLQAKIYLYDMLQAYTAKWVNFQVNFAVQPITQANLPEDGNAVGEFTGMNQASRDAIYARFGGNSGFLFQGLTNRPQINGYRDMVKHWGLQVISWHDRFKRTN